MKAAAVLVLALAAVAATAAPARAQTPPPRSAEPAKLNEAQRRFHRGIELYKEGDLNAALVELTRAYELVPSYKILYNLGQISYQQHDHAAALRTFRRYLADGDRSIPVERRREVAGDIVDLEQRVGSLQIETAEQGAEVFVDDVLVGTTPLRAPIVVNGGRRKVDLVAADGEHRTRMVDVAGGETVRASFPRLLLQQPAADPAPRPRADAVNLSPRPEKPAPAAVATQAAVVVPASGSRQAAKSTFPWKSWTLTAVLAGGAAATGTLAWQSKQELDGQLAKFPADDTEVDYYNRRTRGLALATDGLLLGTAIMAAISLYLTLRDPS